MTWFGWFVVALWTFGATRSIASIGEQSKPSTPGVTAFVVLCMAALVVGVLTVGTGNGLHG